jgi:hypothetical protein
MRLQDAPAAAAVAQHAAVERLLLPLQLLLLILFMTPTAIGC